MRRNPTRQGAGRVCGIASLRLDVRFRDSCRIAAFPDGTTPRAVADVRRRATARARRVMASRLSGAAAPCCCNPARGSAVQECSVGPALRLLVLPVVCDGPTSTVCRPPFFVLAPPGWLLMPNNCCAAPTNARDILATLRACAPVRNRVSPPPLPQTPGRSEGSPVSKQG